MVAVASPAVTSPADPPRPEEARLASSVEDVHLLRGPEGDTGDLVRSLRIWREFTRGFWALRGVGPCVTVFGSARFREGDHWYEMARDVGRRLADAGFAVMTGGGPGIMEAANRGAQERGGRSIGCAIQLPREQRTNPFVDRSVSFHYFFVRKVMLVKYSRAFLFLPGGYGTLDEVFEIATLIQTGKVQRFPIVGMGREYWRNLEELRAEAMLPAGTISPVDAELFMATDDPAAAVAHIVEHANHLR